MISLTSLIRCRNLAVLTPGSKSPFVRASRPIHSFPFRPSFRGTRLDGLGGGGFGGRGDGGRSRDWHTGEARCEVHDAMVVRVLRKVKAFVREEEQKHGVIQEDLGQECGGEQDQIRKVQPVHNIPHRGGQRAKL